MQPRNWPQRQQETVKALAPGRGIGTAVWSPRCLHQLESALVKAEGTHGGDKGFWDPLFSSSPVEDGDTKRIALAHSCARPGDGVMEAQCFLSLSVYACSVSELQVFLHLLYCTSELSESYFHCCVVIYSLFGEGGLG